MRPLLPWLLLVAISTTALAQGAKVFVNNKPFKGKVAGTPADIHLEAAPFFEMLGAKFAFDGSKATVDGDDVEVSVEDGTPMLAARAYTTKVGGKYSNNKEMGSIDIYAYDPMAAARKALVQVLRQSKIKTESDFSVLTLLSRQILQRDLGLAIIEPVELALVTPADMAKAGHGGNLGAFVQYTKERTGKGTANYHFMVTADQPPMVVIRHLSWMWGTTWALTQGVTSDNKLSEGFGTWVAYQTTQKLTGSVNVSNFLHGSSPTQTEGFKKLLEIEKQGGIEAVLHFMKDAGGKH